MPRLTAYPGSIPAKAEGSLPRLAVAPPSRSPAFAAVALVVKLLAVLPVAAAIALVVLPAVVLPCRPLSTWP
jgi:hypothetical protein